MNVLVLTGHFGMGHVSAANAVREEIEDSFSDAQVTIIDLMDYLFPFVSHYIYKAFDAVAVKHHGLYNKLNRMDGHVTPKPVKLWFTHRFKKLVIRYKPDMLVSTWPIGSKYIGAYKKYTGDDIPYITCITDINSHDYWISEKTNAYIVADRSTKDGLIEKGVDADNIYVGGIPVRKNFKKESACRVIGTKEVLIMGGGLGMIPGADDMLSCLSGFEGVHTSVVTGNNHQLLQKLKGKYKNVDIIGYTDNVDELMRNSDVIITKAGGITLFESINTETPMLVLDPFLDQEKDNAGFLERKGIGKVMWDGDENIGDYLRNMLYEDETVSAMRSNMKKIKKEIKGHGMTEAIDGIDKIKGLDPGTDDNKADLSGCAQKYCKYMMEGENCE